MISGLGWMPGGTVFPRTIGVDVAPGGCGIDTDFPREFSLLLGMAQQSGVYFLPYPVSPEADEQVIDPPPGPVALRDIPPRSTGADSKEDAVDQGFYTPGAGASPR